MPLPLTISCCSKSRLVLPFPVYLSGTCSPGWSRTNSRRAVKRLCVCVCVDDSCITNVLLNLSMKELRKMVSIRQLWAHFWYHSVRNILKLPSVHVTVTKSNSDFRKKNLQKLTSHNWFSIWNNNNYYYCFTALCLGLPGSAGTGRYIHLLTPILIINHPLPASSIYCNPWHPWSIYMPDSLLSHLCPSFLWSTSWSGTLHLIQKHLGKTWICCKKI